MFGKKRVSGKIVVSGTLAPPEEKGEECRVIVDLSCHGRMTADQFATVVAGCMRQLVRYAREFDQRSGANVMPRLQQLATTAFIEQDEKIIHDEFKED